MAINLWLGLYNAPGEWPWTYMFLVVIQLIYLIDPPGRTSASMHSFGAAEEPFRKEELCSPSFLKEVQDRILDAKIG